MKSIRVPDTKDRNARQRLQRLIDRVIRTATPHAVGEGWLAEASHYTRLKHPVVTDVSFDCDLWVLRFLADGSVVKHADPKNEKSQGQTLRGGWKAGVRMTLRFMYKEVAALERESLRRRHLVHELRLALN